MAKPVSIAFIACIENNKTASEALLLFSSIREFGGQLSEASIYSFNPRGLGPLTQVQHDELNSLSVRHSDEILNAAYRDYPPANKIFAAARAENVATEDILVFLDSDSVILNEPRELELPKHMLAAATPVWLPGIACLDSHDPAQVFWKRACELCGVNQEPPNIQARLTQAKMSFYCNAGLIVVRRQAGIFSRWLDCFQKLWADSQIMKMLTCEPYQGSEYGPKFFLEQVALAVTLMPVASEMVMLDQRYNCPLHNRSLLQSAYPEVTLDLDTIVHFHYNQAFHQTGFLQSFDPPLKSNSPQYSWLMERLPLTPEVQPAEGKQDFVISFEHRMQSWRESLSRFLAQ